MMRLFLKPFIFIFSASSELFLFSVINNTSTSLGKRLLRERLLSPIIDIDVLNNRYNYIESMLSRDLPSYLMLSDLVLSCSTKPEAFGRTVLEAQAMGKPVVAFNHGGSVELIKENENGTLCKVADINDLAINIEKALQLSAYKRKVLSNKSMSNVNKKFLTKFMCKKTLNLYKKLIKSISEKDINY